MTAYLVAILSLVAIATLVGFGLNIQWGLCGLVNFGIVGFFSLGAYIAALVGLSGAGAFAGLAAAAFACAGASALLALLAARLEDDYLAIVTIGFGEVVRLVTLNEGWLTNGALGLADIPRPFEQLVSAESYPLVFLVFAVALVAVVFVVLEALVRSPFGRALRAVRDDDVVTATLGKSPFVLRIKAFAIGGAIMGLAGALHAFYLTYIDPSQFTPIVTAYAFMAVIAGGRGSNVGLLLGAGSIMLLIEATRFLKDFILFLDATKLSALRLALIGAGIIALLIFRPNGFLQEPRLASRTLLPQRSDPGGAGGDDSTRLARAFEHATPSPGLHAAGNGAMATIETRETRSST
jgi:branched-chain amino acid transport system permease protein